ncbi:MAG: ABC transporter permease subunit [Cyanobacteria bacterium J06648_11]
MFRGTLAILRKELRGYFASPIAYIVAAVFWLLAGFFFTQILRGVVLASQNADLPSQFGQAPPFDAGTEMLRAFLSLLGTLSLFVLPMLTMSLYTEERRRGTMELLATSPVSNAAVAIGKWLASLLFFATLIVPLLVCQVLAYSTTTPGMNYAHIAIAHLGLILLAASVTAIGMFISSLTDNTLIAAVSTFGAILLLWVVDSAAGEGTGAIASSLRHISLLQHFNTWIQGTISTSSVVLFASMCGLGIFLTTQSVEAMRWQSR